MIRMRCRYRCSRTRQTPTTSRRYITPTTSTDQSNDRIAQQAQNCRRRQSPTCAASRLLWPWQHHFCSMLHPTSHPICTPSHHIPIYLPCHQYSTNSDLRSQAIGGLIEIIHQGHHRRRLHRGVSSRRHPGLPHQRKGIPFCALCAMNLEYSHISSSCQRCRASTNESD